MIKHGIELIRDLFVAILFVVAIVFIVVIIFYDKTALTKTVPKSEEYMGYEEINTELEQNGLDSVEEVIINYYIDGTDLKKFEKNNDYIKGKSNPFSNQSLENTNNNSNSIENNQSGTVNNNSSNNSGRFLSRQRYKIVYNIFIFNK